MPLDGYWTEFTINSWSASLLLNIFLSFEMKGKYLLTLKFNLLNFTLLKIYTCIFVQFLSNFSCGKTVWMRLKASPALKGLKEGYTHIFHEIIEHSLHWSPACKNTTFAILSNSQTM